MKDFSVKLATPAAHPPTPLSSSTITAPGIRHRNFFPIWFLWFSVVPLEILQLARSRVVDPDIWFHLRNVQQLFTTHVFPHADSYSFTSAGAPLLNHEWLSEIPYYAIYHSFGLQGLLALTLILWSLIFAGVYQMALRRGANFGDAALVTIVGAALASYDFAPRMRNFGWLCMVVLLLVLERFQRTRRGKGLWVLPLLFALWINLHGSWVFGFIVFGIYLVSGLVDGDWHHVEAERWQSRELRNLLIAAGVSLVAVFLNPYGYKLVRYPFEFLFGLKTNLENSAEWGSVNFHTWSGKLAMLTILSLLAAAWFSRKPWQLQDVLLVAFALWMSLAHLRFLPFAAIILVPILAPRLELLTPYDPGKDKPWLNLVMTLLVFCVLLWSYPSAAQLRSEVDSEYPVAALRFMQQHAIKGRLFHDYTFGGYIEWNAPTLPVFADGRTDLFIYNGVIDDYLKIIRIEQPLELLDKYQIEYVLFPVDTPLSYVLDHSAAWRTIYADPEVRLYERAQGSDGPRQDSNGQARVPEGPSFQSLTSFIAASRSHLHSRNSTRKWMCHRWICTACIRALEGRS